MNPIKLGLPKGSLQDSTFALMSRAGWNFKVSSRSYVPTVDDPEIAARLVRRDGRSSSVGFLRLLGRPLVPSTADESTVSV